MNVIIMAGGNAEHPFSEDCVYKSLAQVKGKAMIRWVVDALRASRQIDEICVIGPKTELEQALNGVEKVHFLENRERMVDNMLAGAEYFRDSEQVMVCTADVPMITGEMIDWLADAFRDQPYGFIYPIIPKEITQARFPDMPRTYVKVREGSYTGGNITCVRPSDVLGCRELINKMMEYRKRPAKLAGMVGAKVLLGVVTGRLKIADGEARVMKMTGIACKAMECPYPEIGSDVDRPSDIPLVEKYL